jgi:hypothetical protein
MSNTTTTTQTDAVVSRVKKEIVYVLDSLAHATAGGVAGSVVSLVLGYLSHIPLVSSASLLSLPALGVTLGFVVPTVKKYLGNLKL